MEETLIAQKVLVLCEDEEAGSWMAELLEDAEGAVLSLDEGTETPRALDDIGSLDGALIFASRLGEGITLSIDMLRATYPEARIILFMREGSLEAARRSLGLRVDEYVTSRCSPRLVKSILRDVLGEKVS